MALNLEKVHDYKRVPGTMSVQLIGTHTAVRIKASGEPPVFVQDGICYAEGGAIWERDQLPPWFWSEAARMTDQALAECGLSREEVQSHLQAPPSPPPASPSNLTAKPAGVKAAK